MFQELYNLYNKNGYSSRVPLEDFNTESFAGILNLFPMIKKEIVDFLDLPDDDYKIETQVKYCLLKEEDQNCIIDLVFRGIYNICFIENKVNSSEGIRQLERYGLALDEYFSGYEKRLVYCTKFSDPKEITSHNFKQVRWYEIAQRLKKYSNKNPIIKDYLNFLKIHKMAQDNTFTPEIILSMQNLQKTLDIINHHITLSEPIFKKVFDISKPISRQINVTGKYRVANYIKDIFTDKTPSTDLLYCIKLSEVKLQTQIWVDNKHPNSKKITELAKDNDEFEVFEYKGGIVINKSRKIYDLLNDKKSDEIIREWFTQSFIEFKEFIDSTPELGWDFKK